jgi:hypothetical protein
VDRAREDALQAIEKTYGHSVVLTSFQGRASITLRAW